MHSSEVFSPFGTAFSGVLCGLIFCPESEYFNRSETDEEYGAKEKLPDGLAEPYKKKNQLKEEETKENEREKEKADEDRELGAKLIQDATNGLKDKVVNKGMVSLSNDCPNIKVL